MGIKQEIEELPKKLVEVTSKRDRQVPGETSWENIQKKFGKGTGFTQALPKLFQYFGAGTYPKEYNPRVHGPYYPSRNYAKGKTKVQIMVTDLYSYYIYVVLLHFCSLQPFNYKYSPNNYDV